MGAEVKKIPWVKKQPVMGTVLRAIAPLVIFSLYLYGWRALLIFLTTNLTAYATEYFFTRRRGEPVTEAVFVTGSLLALSLPPGVPLWIAAVGAVVGIAFGKELFGGFGRNLFNPALVGRAFIFVSFPSQITGAWYEPLRGPIAGFIFYGPHEAVTGATPLAAMASGGGRDLIDLIIGRIPGCIGESSAVLVILGGLYLLYKKVASREIVISALVTYFAAAVLCYLMGWGAPLNPVYAIFAGGLLFGVFFMATDPVSAVASKEGKVAYGAIIGLSILLIRNFGNFPEGTMFAILLGNTFGPIAEMGVKGLKSLRAPEGAHE